MDRSSNQAYVSMMTESLKKKAGILDELYKLTLDQEKLLSDNKMDVDEFTEITEKKGKGIEELNKLDSGFDTLYSKLEIEIRNNQEQYIEEISRMKSLIKRITDFSTKIQVLEKKNYDSFQLYMRDERKKLKKSNLSQQTVRTYAQNMSGSHKEGNSYFVNETK